METTETIICMKCWKRYNPTLFNEEQRKKEMPKCKYCTKELVEPESHTYFPQIYCLGCSKSYNSQDAFSSAQLKKGQAFRRCKTCCQAKHQKKLKDDFREKREREERREMIEKLNVGWAQGADHTFYLGRK